MSEYAPLLDIECRHDFHGGDPSEDLEFVPGQDTFNMAASVGLVLKPLPGGIRILYAAEQVERLVAIGADDAFPFHLTFLLQARDPNFGVITQPTPFREGAVLYFQSDGHGAAALRGSTPVSESDFVSLGQLNELGSGDGFEFPDDVSGCIAVVRVMRNVLPRRYDVSDLPRAFRMHFQSRETRWRYYLLGSLAERVVQVVDLDDQIQFDVGEAILPGERRAVTFTSRIAIPLRARSDRKFSLRASGEGDKVLITRLPVAAPGYEQIEILGGKQTLVSPIFIGE